MTSLVEGQMKEVKGERTSPNIDNNCSEDKSKKKVNTNTINGASELHKQSLEERLLGCTNVGEVNICGIDTPALIDSGSMVTCISREFYDNLSSQPPLKIA